MSTTTPHPKADANGWIKVNDALPEQGQRILFLDKNGAGLDDGIFNGFFAWSRNQSGGAFFWRPYDLPPPVAEKSQQEIDDEAWFYSNSASARANLSSLDSWRAALAWERSRKDK